MPDRHDHDRMNPDPTLAGALQALPSQAPPHDAWPLLAARARHRRRTRRGLLITLPIAAAIALAVILPLRLGGRGAEPMQAPVVRTHAAAPALLRLRTRSQRLQAWVQRLAKASPPLDGRALVHSVDLKEGVGLIDLELGTAHTVTTRKPLWQQRIALLQRLALLHLTATQQYAHTPRANAPTAQHANWTERGTYQ